MRMPEKKLRLPGYFGHLGWNYSLLCECMYYIRFRTSFLIVSEKLN